MKRTLLFILFLVNLLAYAQSKSVKELAIEISDKNYEMWDIVSYANQNITDSVEKAKFVYYWIGLNIEYDYDLYFNKSGDDYYNYQQKFSYNYNPGFVFQKRMGVCIGYSTLFKWFMDAFGIKSEIVIGYIRDERNRYVEIDSDYDFRHAWNVIKLNNRWMIVDATWGTSNDENISDFYFDVNPIRSIITHYPEDSKWQLLEKPLTLEEFNDSKFIKPIWFLWGFTDNPKLKQDENYYYFVYHSNPNKDMVIKLEYSLDNYDYKPILNTKTIIQDGFTYIRFEKQQIEGGIFFKVNILKVGDFYYKDVISFKI